MLGLAKTFGTMKVPDNEDQNGSLCDPTNHFSHILDSSSHTCRQAAEKGTWFPSCIALTKLKAKGSGEELVIKIILRVRYLVFDKGRTHAVHHEIQFLDSYIFFSAIQFQRLTKHFQGSAGLATL